MALVRRGAKSYWYESYRSGGRVTSRYVASGGLARGVGPARLESPARVRPPAAGVRKGRGRPGRHAPGSPGRGGGGSRSSPDRAAAGAADRLLASWYSRVENAFRQVMIASECHQHKRVWRKRRMDTQERAEAEKRVREMWERIASGDPNAYPFVKVAFDAGARREHRKPAARDSARPEVSGPRLTRAASPEHAPAPARGGRPQAGPSPRRTGGYGPVARRAAPGRASGRLLAGHVRSRPRLSEGRGVRRAREGRELPQEAAGPGRPAVDQPASRSLAVLRGGWLFPPGGLWSTSAGGWRAWPPSGGTESGPGRVAPDGRPGRPLACPRARRRRPGGRFDLANATGPQAESHGGRAVQHHELI